MFFVSFFSRFIDRFGPCVLFRRALCQRTNLRLLDLVYFLVHVHQRNCCNRRFSGCLQYSVGESGYAISSWSASAGYSASMLTEGAKVDISANIQHYLIMT